MADTVAFFGATGGCTVQALKLALEANMPCRALARTPEKLKTLLVSKGVTEATLASNLTIIEGNAKDEAVAKQTLSLADGTCVKTIIFGIGAYPTMKGWSPIPVFEDARVTEECMTAVLAALRSLKPASPPLLVAISTTGISEGARDVPVGLLPVYWALKVPHADKKIMEGLVAAAAAVVDIKSIVCRPTLLLDGPSKPTRAGYEGREGGLAIGYNITRDSVGTWIFEEAIKKGPATEWVGQAVTLTN